MGKHLLLVAGSDAGMELHRAFAAMVQLVLIISLKKLIHNVNIAFLLASFAFVHLERQWTGWSPAGGLWLHGLEGAIPIWLGNDNLLLLPHMVLRFIGQMMF